MSDKELEILMDQAELPAGSCWITAEMQLPETVDRSWLDSLSVFGASKRLFAPSPDSPLRWVLLMKEHKERFYFLTLEIFHPAVEVEPHAAIKYGIEEMLDRCSRI